MASRYQIMQSTGPKPFVIYDNELDGYCTLPSGRNLLPLEWRSRAAAEAWLTQCKVAWVAGIVPAPRRWRTWEPPLRSPWEGFMTPVRPEERPR
jgi:hypothetical protein